MEHEHHHEHSLGADIGCGCGHCREHGHEHHDHDHEHHHDHDHKHHHGAVGRADIICLIAGAVLFVAALIMEHVANSTANMLVLPVCIIAYLLLGREVLLASAKNIARGEVFDENFLMAVATLAAFGIGDYLEAVGVMLFFNIGELFEHISVDRSRERIAEAVDMRPETVNVIHGDHTHETPAEEVKTGTLIMISPGERIPLDGEVTCGEGIIDTSPVTGEPTPVHAKAGMKLLSGCINQRGQFTLKVTAPLEESMVSRILESVENAAAGKPEIEKFITKFARIYTPIVVGLAVLVAIIPPLLLGGLWKHWILTAVTFLVISCPCAMVISVPLAFFLGVGAASKAGILVKSGQALEALRKIKIVALDKTGTLTKGIVEDAGLLDVDGGEENFEAAFAKKTVSSDKLKDDAKAGIAQLKSLGIDAAMLTGDRRERAVEIAGEAGISAENVRSELLPDEKLSALQQLREEHGEIMFVGDGINDAPVLAGADVGAAMGSGADAAIESADIVFMNSNVSAISQAIRIAGRTGGIAKQNIVLALAIKILILVLGFLGFANIWLAVFADTGVAMLCILNSLRLLKQ
ncbi:MAG: HAD-IC family P-type ATPase [Clostridia bacterium]|nr:HAD-IC family P-type ATPase [Clostridia bacterium]